MTTPKNKIYKIRDLYKVKLYTIRSETKKRERKKREIERQIYVNPSTDRGSYVTLINPIFLVEISWADDSDDVSPLNA